MLAQRRETSVNWLREVLRDWASWYNGRADAEQSGTGFSSSTVLGEAVSGRIHAPPTACIPHGVQPPRGLEKVCHAMIVLMGDERLGWYVAATRHFYLHDENIEAVMAEFGCTSKRAAWSLRERGEDALRAFLRA